MADDDINWDDMSLGADGEITGGDGEELTPKAEEDKEGEESGEFGGAIMAGYHLKILEACTKLSAVPSQWFVTIKHNMSGDKEEMADLSAAEIYSAIMSHPDDKVKVMNGIIISLKRAVSELEEQRDEAQRNEDNETEDDS